MSQVDDLDTFMVLALYFGTLAKPEPGTSMCQQISDVRHLKPISKNR